MAAALQVPGRMAIDDRRYGTAPERRRPPVPPRATRLERDLRDVVQGEVRFGDGDRALYATDASNYRQVPIGVVVPRTVDDVVHAVAVARAHDAPVLGRGGGTSLGGQACNAAVVIDTSKYLDRVLAIDPHARRARVQPGLVLDRLRAAAARHGLTFGPDPATHSRCTLGGMIGNNSCGVHSVQAEFYGPGPLTQHHVLELDVLTYDGTRLRVGPTSDAELAGILRAGGRRAAIYAGLRDLRDRHAAAIRARFPRIPRAVSGYNLPPLLPEHGFDVARALVGTESTCVIVLEATVALIPDLPARALLVLGYPSVFDAGDHVAELRALRPVGLEGMDHLLAGYIQRKGLRAEDLGLLPEGRGWLLVEFGGETPAEARARAEEAAEALRRQPRPPSLRLYDDPARQTRIWHLRESGLGATAFVPGEADAWPGWEDSAVPPERIGDYLRDLRRLFERHGYRAALYGHFGQGCVHTRIPFELTTTAGIDRFRAFTREAAELVVGRYGGSLSGEHGDGQARADLLPVMFGDELVAAFRTFKRLWDPDNRMNPGKVVDPAPRDTNLRLGTRYRPPAPATHFRFPDDGGSFARAALRCVGVGECRRTEHGTMCPSFMVLREEKHTTRGRAHLLFEMLQGDVVRDGWRSEAVKESLDLCLSCKGCKSDCPVNVDVATYKAEFLAHHYAGRWRPRQAYVFGLIDRWARLASRAPRLANLLTRAPGLAALARAAAGIAPERRIPAFAPRTFTHWFHARGRRDPGGSPVLLWPDTFTNHFHPETARAAVEVLEAAGHRVIVPREPLCCGRPLYEYGMLDRAKRLLGEILDTLDPLIAAGVPLVGLEPSCTAVFRDELHGLFPHDAHAERLRRQTFTLGEFLARRSDGWSPPRLGGRAIVQAHCHHKAIMGTEGEQAVLGALGLDVEVLDSGCCGMAGAFGFEAAKYEVSVKAGERVLLPAVRRAPRDALIVADGFSCREQIAQGTGRRALHLAEVVALALRAKPGARPGAERRGERRERVPPGTPVRAAVLGAAVLAGTLAWQAARRRAA